MNKEKLIELSKQYFDNKKDLNQIVACSDGNFFYNEVDASYHFSKNKLDKYLITREDVYPIAIEEKPEEVKKEPKKVEKKVKKVIKNGK